MGCVVQMEARAQNGCGECRRFMLTLYRLLAIQIMERLHELFMATVGDSLAALGHARVHPVPCDNLSSVPGSAENMPPRGKGGGGGVGGRWRGRHSTTGSSVGGSAVPREEVQCMWIAVRSLLQRAQLLVLEPGAQGSLRSSAVLLRGSLRAASEAGGKRSKRLPCAAAAPCALLWSASRESAAEGAVEVCAGAVATRRTCCVFIEQPPNPRTTPVAIVYICSYVIHYCRCG